MNFYVARPQGQRFGTRWAYAGDARPLIFDDSQGERCPVCGQHWGQRWWLPPHRITLSSAKPEKWGDFLWGTSFPFMVSGRFKALYESEGLSGITLFHPPAEIVRVGTRKTGDFPFAPPVYHLVVIRWDGANLDDEVSRVVRKRIECSYHRGAVEAFERVVLEPGSWRGADIFEARGLPGRIIVSQRFKEVVDKHQLKNIELIPIEEHSYDVQRVIEEVGRLLRKDRPRRRSG